MTNQQATTYVEPDEDATAVPLTGGDVTEGVLRIVGKPRPPWVADEDRLVSVSKLVRACNDAAADLVLPQTIGPFSGTPETAAISAAPTYPVETIGHMDITPDNVVFRDGVAVGLIDFDLARPVARVDEVHNLMLHWAPLVDPVDADPPLRDVDVPRRCRIIADAYGLGERDRARLVEVAAIRAHRSWFSMRQLAQTRGGGWARMWQEGIGDQSSAGRPGWSAMPRRSTPRSATSAASIDARLAEARGFEPRMGDKPKPH